LLLRAQSASNLAAFPTREAAKPAFSLPKEGI